MTLVRRIIPFLCAAALCAACAADPVQITVAVTDPEGNPVHGAGVQYFFTHTDEPAPKPATMTNAAGVANVIVESPDKPFMSGFIKVGMGLRESDSIPDAALRWNNLKQQWQFPSLGIPFQILAGQKAVEVSATAIPTVEIVGQARAGSEPLRVDLFGRTGAPAVTTESDNNGNFTIRVARVSPIILITAHDWSMFVAPTVPPEAETIDIGVIQFEQPMGRLAGHVLVNGAPAPPGDLYALRLDGAVLMMLFSDGGGRLDDDINPPGPDPGNPSEGIDIPAGEYVLFRTSLADYWSDLAAYTAVTQGVAQAELAALPHVTIPPGGRGVVTIDLDQLTTATKALVDAALGP